MAQSQAFEQLHEGIRRWVWMQRWTALRDIQEQAIAPILGADRDVIISASTAAGKTEAAFLPACSLVTETSPDGIGILYISPLKALINDQYRRLQGLCELLGFPVTPWHGDVPRSIKDKQKKSPTGILLITPESLESLLLNRAGWCSRAFREVCYIIVDEFHAFLGTERGCQLQSLMHRLEFMLGRTIPRLALSATLGDLEQVARYLRPSGTNDHDTSITLPLAMEGRHTRPWPLSPRSGFPCAIIESKTSHADLKLQLRGYLDAVDNDNEPLAAMDDIKADLYRILRGKSHLVFANSRARTEEIAAALSDYCAYDGVPNEFFPHHGSLSREIRESLETRLQEGRLPTTAVCTMTLELGIDIGHVDSIAQVTPPYSVADLRQRLGRSGRRGGAAVLRLFIPENQLTVKNNLSDRLRLGTIQSVAMVNLLLRKWYEPAPEHQYHLSTLVQQTLSVIGQYGGVRADQLWSLLCDTGPFSLVDQALYADFLRALGRQDLITQTGDGQLVLGYQGERLVGHYDFYAAFNTPEEYRLECEGRTLGTLPIANPLVIGQLVIFAGRRWQVLHINAEKKLITLKSAAGGKPPMFGGDFQMVHDGIRQEMLRVYRQKAVPVYLDKPARLAFEEGIECFHTLGLDKARALQIGNTVHVFPWLGDRVTNTLTVLLRNKGLAADCFGGLIDIKNSSLDAFYEAVKTIRNGTKPFSSELAGCVPDTIAEKHDSVLPRHIRDLAYGARFFDVDGAWKWMRELSQ